MSESHGRATGGPESRVAPGLLPDEERSGPPVVSFENFKPLGYYSAWGMYEFDYDEEGNVVGSHEVERMSGEGPGFTWEISSTPVCQACDGEGAIGNDVCVMCDGSGMADAPE